MEEYWKDIAGYEGYYQVSSLGRVKPLARIIIRADGYPKTIPEKIMSQTIGTNGYNLIVLNKFGRFKGFAVHRLVAEAFIPNTSDKEQVNHINEIKTDNRIENLEWVTPKQNINHRGAHVRSEIGHWERICMLDKEGRIIRFFDSVTETNKFFNNKNARDAVFKCLTGRSKTSFGYKWRYANDKL